MSRKKEFGVAMDPKLVTELDKALLDSDFKSRSEIISEAVMFYLATLNTKDISKVLSPAVESSIRAATHESENHISSMLYKMAVELDILMHVTAATNDIDYATLRKLRGMCVKEVNSSTGKISFESAYRIQKG